MEVKTFWENWVKQNIPIYGGIAAFPPKQYFDDSKIRVNRLIAADRKLDSKALGKR